MARVNENPIVLPHWAVLAAPVLDIFLYTIGRPQRIEVQQKGDELRMYCVVSKEALTKMNGSRGKFGSQCGHAYLHAYWDAERRNPITALRYRYSGAAAKITMVEETTAGLIELNQLAETDPDLGASLTTDAGRTTFKEPTVTTLGLGPTTKADADWLLNGNSMLT
jgi:peptidyl-tRNA hydrolase